MTSLSCFLLCKHVGKTIFQWPLRPNDYHDYLVKFLIIASLYLIRQWYLLLEFLRLEWEHRQVVCIHPSLSDWCQLSLYLKDFNWQLMVAQFQQFHLRLLDQFLSLLNHFHLSLLYHKLMKIFLFKEFLEVVYDAQVLN